MVLTKGHKIFEYFYRYERNFSAIVLLTIMFSWFGELSYPTEYLNHYSKYIFIKFCVYIIMCVCILYIYVTIYLYHACTIYIPCFNRYCTSSFRLEYLISRCLLFTFLCQRTRLYFIITSALVTAHVMVKYQNIRRITRPKLFLFNLFWYFAYDYIILGFLKLKYGFWRIKLKMRNLETIDVCTIRLW